MNLDQFMKSLKAKTSKPKRVGPPPNSAASRLQINGGLHPYDSHKQRERYARQEARRLHKLAMRAEHDDEVI